ncbi:MAG: outer membrane protein [Solidesulfovibrio magneticus str. Maddingley MBC34]|uniref:Outer membrane protein n=1 Tax=Solidesulfovibrio magneticus str. Maddingley MBC34 TaxID=1206767 RepID=K6H5V7_9BACT|nr:MAG: outer membrane protein [Solidesulfovibrio magneticus str. Maddingley MBC34]
MPLRFRFLLALGALLLCSGCQMLESKPTTAVINTRDVITKCNAGMQAAEKVRAKFAARQDALKKQEEAIEKLKIDPALNDPKTGKQAELEKLARQYVADTQTLRKDVGEEEAATFKPIVDRINKVLAAYSKEHGLLSVQDKNGFAFIDPRIDITEDIIKLVDEAK